MKQIGMIGGMSWESSLAYYRLLNEGIRTELGGLHSARCILYSLEFEEIEKLQHEGKWEELTQLLTQAARDLKNSGADFGMICTNTMHKTADEIQQRSGLELLHIADAAGAAIRQQGLLSVALLGTKFPMEQDFYRQRLADRYGLRVLVPEEAEREEIHRMIYQELCQGIFRQSAKDYFRQVIDKLAKQGAEGIVLGCTEIPLLVKAEDSSLPLFDTMELHARAAVKKALE